MTASKKRPKYLNLIQIRLPIAGIISIAHRVSGVFMFLAIPALVYLLHLSALSRGGFNMAMDIVTSIPAKLILLVLIWSLFHHLFAGIRYLLIDMDIGVDKSSARMSAMVVFFAGIASVMVFGWVLL